MFQLIESLNDFIAINKDKKSLMCATAQVLFRTKFNSESWAAYFIWSPRWVTGTGLKCAWHKHHGIVFLKIVIFHPWPLRQTDEIVFALFIYWCSLYTIKRRRSYFKNQANMKKINLKEYTWKKHWESLNSEQPHNPSVKKSLCTRMAGHVGSCTKKNSRPVWLSPPCDY